MGIFDFLKKKEQKTAEQIEKTVQKETKPYLGDLKKTDILFKLVQTPQNERDETWQQVFLENIGQASFCSGEPQIITGSDGFPYFQLFLPEPNKSFQCYVIDKMKDDFLLASGFGVVINPTPNSADWVLSYGDILSYNLNQTFYTITETPFSREKNDETIVENEKVCAALLGFFYSLPYNGYKKTLYFNDISANDGRNIGHAGHQLAGNYVDIRYPGSSNGGQTFWRDAMKAYRDEATFVVELENIISVGVKWKFIKNYAYKKGIKNTTGKAMSVHQDHFHLGYR